MTGQAAITGRCCVVLAKHGQFVLVCVAHFVPWAYLHVVNE